MEKAIIPFYKLTSQNKMDLQSLLFNFHFKYKLVSVIKYIHQNTHLSI